MANANADPLKADASLYHTVIIHMVSQIVSGGDLEWFAEVRFNCVDMPRFMREGLHWTTRNIEADQSWWRINPDDFRWKFSRYWITRQHPDKPARYSRWRGQVLVQCNSVAALSAFRLHTLRRHHIVYADVRSSLDNEVFSYRRSKPDININCIDDSDRFDLWWLWPMETGVRPESLGCRAWRKLVCLLGWGYTASRELFRRLRHLPLLLVYLAILYALCTTYIYPLLCWVEGWDTGFAAVLE